MVETRVNEQMTLTEPVDTALEVRPTAAQIVPVKGREPLPFEPETFDQAWRMAGALQASSLLPKELQGKQADVAMVLMKGRELGLSPVQSLEGIYVVNGKTGTYADTMVGLCLRSGVCRTFRCTESTDATCTYETVRTDTGAQVERETFTIEDAHKMGLTGRDQWKKMPKIMLRHRAAAFLARRVYPDVVGGLHDRDELLEASTVDAKIRAIRERAEESGEITVPEVPATRTESVKRKLRQKQEELPGTTAEVEAP